MAIDLHIKSNTVVFYKTRGTKAVNISKVVTTTKNCKVISLKNIIKKVNINI